METLIHTADGKLQVDDPLLRVGTRGLYGMTAGAHTNFRWIVTEEALDRVRRDAEQRERRGRRRNEAYVYGHPVTRHNPGRLKADGSILMNRQFMHIVNPTDDNYFEVKGY